MTKCTKPHCNCAEIEIEKQGTEAIKSYPCLKSDTSADEIKKPITPATTEHPALANTEVRSESESVKVSIVTNHTIGDNHWQIKQPIENIEQLPATTEGETEQKEGLKYLQDMTEEDYKIIFGSVDGYFNVSSFKSLAGWATNIAYCGRFTS